MSNNEYSGRVKKAKQNILYGFLQVIVSKFLPFITRTILIYRFGVDYLGMSSLFASILSVLSLMELGFGTAVVYSMYKPAAEDDTDQICAYLSYYWKIYHFIGLAILAVGLVLIPFLNQLIHDPVLPGELNLYICYLIFLGNAVISYLLYGFMTAIPLAYQRRDILSKVDIVLSVLQCSVKIIVLLTSSNFYMYLLSIPALTVIRNLVTAGTIKRRYPELKCRGELSTDQKRDLNKRVYGLVIEKITSVSRNSIDTLCISAFIGLVVTGMYNNYYFVMTSIISFSTMVLNSMMASVGNSIAVESREKNYADMRMFDYIYTGIAGWATVCMLCLYQPFIKVWLGEGMMLGMPVVLGLCAYFYILKSGDIRYVYHEGNGLWHESRFIMISEAVVNIIMNIVLCKIMGVFGIILATVISVFITNFIFCPRLLFRLYFQNGKLKEYWMDHFFYTITMALTAGVSWFVCEAVLPMNMVEGREVVNCVLCLGGRLFVCSVLSVFIFWIIWHRSDRYTKAVGWLKRLVKV